MVTSPPNRPATVPSISETAISAIQPPTPAQAPAARPKQRRRRPTRAESLPNIVDQATFNSVHRTVNDLIATYLRFPLKNYVRLPYRIAFELDRKQRNALYANNLQSRIDFANCAYKIAAPRLLNFCGPIVLVTITSADHVVPLADAKDFDVRRVQALTREALRGLSFIGMVEGALYRNWGPNGATRGDFVSWHSHAIVWGRTAAEILSIAKPKLAGHRSILPHRSAIHAKSIPAHRLESSFFYITKQPQKEYRVYGKSKELIDSETGEIIAKSSFAQIKRLLRTGDRVRMCRAFEDRLLDKLMFGGREGTGLCKAIAKLALRSFNAQEKERLRRDMQLKCRPRQPSK